MDTKETFIPTPPEGLTHQEAAARAAQGLDNRPVKDPGKSVGKILRDNLFTLFNLLNLVLALSLALVGSWRNMLFMGVVLSNLFIGTFQELRAKRTIDRLTLLSQAKVRAIREGEEVLLPPEQLVQGDLAVFHAGDQLCADGVMRFGQGAANEALLTGESDPVLKMPGDTLLSGSFVTEGILTVQLTRVGEESYASQLIKSAKAIRKPHSELMTSLSKIIRLVSILLVPLGLILFAKQYFLLNQPIQEAVPSTVAAVLGMIPEGLMLLTSMALAVGVIKLGMKNTLVQELYGIESLARVDTLCLDKTGTITQGTMAVEQRDEGLEEAVGFFLSAFEKEESPTLAALREAYPPCEADPETMTVPFSSARKWSGAYSPARGAVAVGAPEFILDQRWPQLLKRAADLSREGLRVLAVVVSHQPFEDQQLPQERQPLGLVCLSDTIRPEAPETLRFFREQGVEVKVISGDNPLTVSQVARRAGLENWDQAVDAATLDTPEKLYEAAGRCTVFGRVTPQQKQQLVEAMKQQGRTVAMTGDGVNDIPALKAADCSIAMAGGSDAAKHVAQLTLLDANFAVMPQIVMEGRRVINNITRAASLFLVKTLFSFLLSVALLVLPLTYPFQPIQLTLVSSLTVGVPTFFLALEPNRQRVQGNFLRTVFKNAIPGAVCIVAGVLLTYALQGTLAITQAQVSTLCTLTAGFTGLAVLFKVCLPFDWKRGLLMGLMTIGFYGAAWVLPQVFFLAPLPPAALVWLGAWMALSVLILWGVGKGLDHWEHKTHRSEKAQGL